MVRGTVCGKLIVEKVRRFIFDDSYYGIFIYINVQINNFTKGNHKGLLLPANMLSVGAIPCGCPVK